MVQKQRFLKVAVQAARAGAEVTTKFFRRLKHVDEKKGAGLVSEADRESESVIRRILLTHFPDHCFWGEEGGFRKKAGKSKCSGIWHVDPLDGTTNYVHGFPLFCTSIGLELEGELEVAAVYAPLMGYLFTAERGHGAYLNGKRIHVSESRKLTETLLATGFSYKKSGILDAELVDFRKLSQKARGIRRGGSAALDLCLVGAGIFDGFWERELSPWDTAAGTLIVREAGGIVTAFDGTPHRPEMKTILAANPSIHKHLLRTLKSSRRRSH